MKKLLMLVLITATFAPSLLGEQGPVTCVCNNKCFRPNVPFAGSDMACPAFCKDKDGLEKVAQSAWMQYGYHECE